MEFEEMMKRYSGILLLFLLAAPAFAQTAQELDRDKSKYATYNFDKDDQYTEQNPYATVSVCQPKGRKVKNVIFMIGDGMGYEQVACGWVLNGGKLNMDAMPYSGTSRTYALDKLVTDSAAGGSALATGNKTTYGYIASNPDGSPAESVLKYAQGKGMKTGVAVTCRINDATPADFCCNSVKRSMEAEIAAQYVDSGVDFISGGGLHFWRGREDGRDLIGEMQAKGYTFVATPAEIAAAQGTKILALFDEYELQDAVSRGPVLEDCTMKAIEVLDNRNGFFLMVEGSMIDDECHRHKIGPMAEELFDFDRTVGKVLEWAEKDGQTLVVVTADHATGGLTLLRGSLENREVKVNFSTGGHNSIFVPVFSYGPQAEKFAGVHENSEIGQIVREILSGKK